MLGSMRWLRLFVGICAVCGLLAAEASWAHGRSGRSGGSHSGAHRFLHHHHYAPVFRGAIIASPLYAFPAPYPYYYAPPPAPPVYMQQPDPHYWYYCPSSATYYPYVKECPGGWQRIVPSAQPLG